MASATGPIADLSYRNYDGPLDPLTFRWWAIAKMFMRMAIKKKGFWWWSALSALWYFVMGAVFYFTDTLAQQASTVSNRRFNFMDNIIWKDQFLDGLSMGQLFVFIVTLLIGAGAIAADNRANALLVYLSKPCTKLDYLLGKWLGIFLMLCAVMAVPAIVFYGFSLLSYREYGHWDALILPKLLIIIPLISALYASMILGISSLFNQARIAGATYAGIWFLTAMLTSVFSVIRQEADISSPVLDNMTYFSVEGMQRGITKAILNTAGGAPFSVQTPRSAGMEFVPPPSLIGILLIHLLLCAVFIWIAWKKVRAVEVVGS